MKLYATVTSERASKGQGGNEYIDIEMSLDSREKIGTVKMLHRGNGDTQIVFQPSPRSLNGSDDVILRTIKGERQKGEVKDCSVMGCMGTAYPSGTCKRHAGHY